MEHCQCAINEVKHKSNAKLWLPIEYCSLNTIITLSNTVIALPLHICADDIADKHKNSNPQAFAKSD